MEPLSSKFLKDRKGSTSVMFALALPAILGGVVLITEVGLWRANKAELQATVDMAAIAAAYEYSRDEVKSASKRAAYADALDNEFDPTTGNLTTHIPPITGKFVGDDAVQVYIEQEIPTYLSKIFLKKPIRAEVRAVAKLSGASVKACVLALAQNGTAISIGGSVEVRTEGCGLHANSTSTPAFNVFGAVEITAACASSSGTTQIGGSKPKVFTDCPNPLSNKDPVVDPYAGTTVPPNIGSEPCQSPNVTGNGNNAQMTFPDANGGVVRICNNKIEVNQRIDLEPGTYVFDGTELSFKNSGLIAGDDVTLIFMNDAEMDNINGGNGFDLAAPDSGDYAGIAMFADPHTMSNDVWKFNGNAVMSIYGALYLPTLDIEYVGGAGTYATECTQLVANRISFNGNSGFKNNCDPAGAKDIWGPGSSRVALVE